MTNLDSLNCEQLEEIQKNISFLLDNRNSNFFVYIQKNNTEKLKDFIEWGIPTNDQFEAQWKELVLSTNISKETLDILNTVLKDRYVTTYQYFINKIYILATNYFKQGHEFNVFNIKNDKATDNLMWILEKFPSLFNDRIKDSVQNNWGNIIFDPIKHKALEEYVLNSMAKPHKALLKISKIGNSEQMKHFFSNKYTKSLYLEDKPEVFLTECLEKSLHANNAAATKFWLEKKVPLPTAKNSFISIIQNNLPKNDNERNAKLEMISNVVEYAQTPLFNEQVLLNTAVEHNRLFIVKHLLDNYYDTLEKVQEAKKVLHKKRKNESVEYLMQFIKYQSLNLSLEQKPETTNKFKI